MKDKFFRTFKIIETPNELQLRRVLIPSYWWAFLVLFILYFAAASLKGINLASFALIIVLILPLIWWNWFSKYPSLVFISDGFIRVRFRLLYDPNRVIEITSLDHPDFYADSYRRRDGRVFHYYGRVRVERIGKSPITIYVQAQSSIEEADRIATEFAEVIAKRCGFQFNKT